jgi:hypothetical protein
MKNYPEKIYIQRDEEGNFDTWCVDRIDDNMPDIVYIRNDIHLKRMRKQKGKFLKYLKGLGMLDYD